MKNVMRLLVFFSSASFLFGFVSCGQKKDDQIKVSKLVYSLDSDILKLLKDSVLNDRKIEYCYLSNSFDTLLCFNFVIQHKGYLRNYKYLIANSNSNLNINGDLVPLVFGVENSFYARSYKSQWLLDAAMDRVEIRLRYIDGYWQVGMYQDLDKMLAH